MKIKARLWYLMAMALFIATITIGCSSTPAEEVQMVSPGVGIDEPSHETDVLQMPELQPADLGDAPLQVIATTSILGDVVAQVGGETIALTTLIGPGQDPHSYEPAARDLTAVDGADVIFVNGWNLEEGLVDNLLSINPDIPVVPVSAGITPLTFNHQGESEQDEPLAEGSDHDHGNVDPHVWFNVRHVEQWVNNVEETLAVLDPANSETYRKNAGAYRAELAELEDYVESEVSKIPQAKRLLITNHNALGYFADAYGFTILDTVIPAASTLAEPSAADLAGLVATMEANDLCTIFSETTFNDTLSQTVAAELRQCAEVKVVPLYTGAIGPPGSGADSYITMIKSNVDRVVGGLQ